MTMRRGIMNNAARVEAEDIAIDSATLPFDQWVKRLDVEPPGAQPMRTTPVATKSEKPNHCAVAQAKRGMKPNCEAKPASEASRGGEGKEELDFRMFLTFIMFLMFVASFLATGFSPTRKALFLFFQISLNWSRVRVQPSERAMKQMRSRESMVTVSMPVGSLHEEVISMEL